jgi:hypothetical protein
MDAEQACPLCNVMFNDYNQLELHVERCTGEAPVAASPQRAASNNAASPSARLMAALSPFVNSPSAAASSAAAAASSAASSAAASPSPSAAAAPSSSSSASASSASASANEKSAAEPETAAQAAARERAERWAAAQKREAERSALRAANKLPSSFVASELRKGLLCDVLDPQREWCEGEIRDVNSGNKSLLIHYVGWPSKWDECKCDAARAVCAVLPLPHANVCVRWWCGVVWCGV